MQIWGKHKVGARGGKYKFGARAGKHKVGARVGKYKLGARVVNKNWELGPGAKQKAEGWEIQSPLQRRFVNLLV